MTVNPDLVSPCGLYCGVCAIYIAHRENNQKFKERSSPAGCAKLSLSIANRHLLTQPSHHALCTLQSINPFP